MIHPNKFQLNFKETFKGTSFIMKKKKKKEGKKENPFPFHCCWYFSCFFQFSQFCCLRYQKKRRKVNNKTMNFNWKCIWRIIMLLYDVKFMFCGPISQTENTEDPWLIIKNPWSVSCKKFHKNGKNEKLTNYFPSIFQISTDSYLQKKKKKISKKSIAL